MDPTHEQGREPGIKRGVGGIKIRGLGRVVVKRIAPQQSQGELNVDGFPLPHLTRKFDSNDQKGKADQEYQECQDRKETEGRSRGVEPPFYSSGPF